MKALFPLVLISVLAACGGGGSDDQENSPTSSTSSTDAQCVFTPDQDGGLVNLGEYKEPSESENDAEESSESETAAVAPSLETLARLKVDYFIASCTGDVNVTINQDSGNTTTGAE